MSTTASAPAPGPDRLGAVEQFKTMLASERAKVVRVQGELEMRNFALDCAPIHLLILDVSAARWAITYVNRTVAKDHGYEPIELIGRTPGSILPMDFNRDAFSRVEEAMQAATTIRVELTSRRKDGTTFPVEYQVTPIKNPDGPVKHCVAVGTDITARIEHDREVTQPREQLSGAGTG